MGVTSVRVKRPGFPLYGLRSKAPGNYLVPSVAPLLSAGLEAGGGKSPSSEVPDLGGRRPGSWGRGTRQGGAGKLVLGKRIKWPKARRAFAQRRPGVCHPAALGAEIPTMLTPLRLSTHRCVQCSLPSGRSVGGVGPYRSESSLREGGF